MWTSDKEAEGDGGTGAVAAGNGRLRSICHCICS